MKYQIHITNEFGKPIFFKDFELSEFMDIISKDDFCIEDFDNFSILFIKNKTKFIHDNLLHINFATIHYKEDSDIQDVIDKIINNGWVHYIN